MKKINLINHKVFNAVTENFSVYLKKCDIVKRKKPKQTKSEIYTAMTFWYLMNIVRCIDQLYCSLDMLSNYKNKIKNQGMNRAEYIAYGIENIYLRITSVFDRSLRLANVIFEVGLPERDCKTSTIINNENIKSTETGKCLKMLEKSIEKFKNKRNEIAHKNSYDDEEFYEIEIFELLQNCGRLDTSQYIYGKQKMDEYVIQKKKSFMESINSIEQIVNQLFDAISNEYQKRNVVV